VPKVKTSNEDFFIMITVYGIKTCDTVRKALKWLEVEGIEHSYHDFRADGIDAAIVQRWVDALGWESVLNKRSTTWKKMAAADKDDLNAARAIQIMAMHPTLSKRPVFEGDGFVLQGFTNEIRSRLC